jgi:hypothetical protein
VSSLLDSGEPFVSKANAREVASGKFITHYSFSSPHTSLHRLQTARSTGEALKFTRHLPMVTRSPLGLYFASKGSTAWETSVKTRTDLEFAPDDLPVGWRVIQKSKPNESESKTNRDLSKRSSFLSFWGKKSNQPLSDLELLSKDSENAPSRSSLDVAEAPSVPTSLKPTVSPSTSVLLNVPTKSTALTSDPLTTGVVPIRDPSVDIRIANPTPEASQAAPSAVSRFFNRFSRSSRTTASALSRHNSIALSGDDLEFLNDLNLVPSAADDDISANDPQIQALQNMMKETPYMAANKVKTPVLAPPPPPPKISFATLSNLSGSTSSIRSPTNTNFIAEKSSNNTGTLRADPFSSIQDDAFGDFASFTTVSEQPSALVPSSRSTSTQLNKDSSVSFWDALMSTPSSPTVAFNQPVNRSAETR